MVAIANLLFADHPPIAGQSHTTMLRWLEAARRRRLLEGKWLQDLELAILTEVGDEKRRYWGVPDISKNIFRDVVSQLSVLYDSEGSIAHESEDAVAAMHTRLAMWWPFMREHQRFVEGIRECLLKVDMVPTDDPDKSADQWKPIFQTITPDLYDIEFDKRDPSKMIKIKHWVQRTIGDSIVWTTDVWSLKDGDAPYAIFDDKGEDISGRVLTEDQRKGWFDGQRYLPFVHYHAAITGKNYNTHFGAELVCMAYKVGVFWTYWGHLLKDCSYPARWGKNVYLMGTASDEVTGTEYVTSDPNVFYNFKSQGNHDGELGQFQPGGDPKSTGEAIIMYTADGLNSWGISQGDNMRVSADPRSGFAIALSRETIREHQAKALPAFRQSDIPTINLIARLSNEADALDLPISGYTITYRGIPPSAQEQSGKQDRDKKRVELNQASYADLYAEEHGLSVQQAQDALLRKQELNDALGSPGNDATSALSASAIVKDVHAKTMPVEGGIALLMQFFGLAEDTAKAMLAGKMESEEVDGLGIGVDAAQDTALNGAQVESALAIVQELVLDKLTTSMAKEMLISFFNLKPDSVDRMLAGAENLTIKDPSNNDDNDEER